MEEDNYYPAEQPEPQEEERAEGATALVPLDFLPQEAKKPGSTLTIRIVHLYDDEAEISIETES
jgi:hypothetical protein